MKEIKIVFLQADEEDMSGLAKMLDSVKHPDYFFLLIPPTTNVLSKEEVLQMLKHLPD